VHSCKPEKIQNKKRAAAKLGRAMGAVARILESTLGGSSTSRKPLRSQLEEEETETHDE
jgi:hypothetical protein